MQDYRVDQSALLSRFGTNLHDQNVIFQGELQQLLTLIPLAGERNGRSLYSQAKVFENLF